MNLVNNFKLMFRKRVPKKVFSDYPDVGEQTPVLLPHPKPAPKKGKVVSGTKPKQWQVKQKHRRGGTVKAMPRELRRIKRAQAREQAISE